MDYNLLILVIVIPVILISLGLSLYNVYLASQKLKQLKKNSGLLDQRLQQIDQHLEKAKEKLARSLKDSSRN